jgi:rare lipoprotein A
MLKGGGIMARWLVVLGLVVTQCPAVAGALPGSLEDHARPGEASVMPKTAQQDTQPAVEPAVQDAPVQGPPKQTRADSGCDAGRRVIAASYGQGQHTTSSGERFDRRRMTAAHRTLPFGTRLTVTNPKTGKSVIVVVNDRGPFTRSLDIDLSIAAARAIGMNGIAAVCIE